MIARLKLWAAAAGAVALALVGAWLKGRASGSADVRAKTAAARQEATAKAQEIENEVEALSPDDLAARARKWVRGADR